MTMTPTELGLFVALIAVGGVAVGGVIAGVFTLITGFIQRRSEHKRWIREQRLAAYLRFAGLVERFRSEMLIPPSGASGKARSLPWPELFESMAAISLVGPLKVRKEARAVAELLIAGTSTDKSRHPSLREWTMEREKFMRSASSVLGAKKASYDDKALTAAMDAAGYGPSVEPSAPDL